MAFLIESPRPIQEGSNIICMARLVGQAGQMLLPHEVESISYSVFDVGRSQQSAYVRRQPIVDQPTRIAGPIAVDVEQAVFSTPQFDHWEVDDTGYNFRLLIHPAHLPATTVTDFVSSVTRPRKHGLIEASVALIDSVGSMEVLGFSWEIQPTLTNKV